jgi:hypothetical protein
MEKSKPLKIKLLKKLRNRFFWKIENNQWIIYDRKQNKELNIKVNKSNDAVINLLTHYINESFVCLEVRKLHSQKKRLKTKYKSKFTNTLSIF